MQIQSVQGYNNQRQLKSEPKFGMAYSAGLKKAILKSKDVTNLSVEKGPSILHTLRKAYNDEHVMYYIGQDGRISAEKASIALDNVIASRTGEITDVEEMATQIRTQGTRVDCETRMDEIKTESEKIDSEIQNHIFGDDSQKISDLKKVLEEKANVNSASNTITKQLLDAQETLDRSQAVFNNIR